MKPSTSRFLSGFSAGLALAIVLNLWPRLRTAHVMDGMQDVAGFPMIFAREGGFVPRHEFYWGAFLVDAAFALLVSTVWGVMRARGRQNRVGFPVSPSTTEPRWIDCASIEDIPPPTSLAAMATRETHVVLCLPTTVDSDAKAALIGQLSKSLPEYSVFDSGGRSNATWITIKPVVPRQQIIEHREHLLRAIEDYRQTCIHLMDQYRAGRLPSGWEAAEHGRQCCFTNQKTGQWVEAPMDGRLELRDIDPYFLAKFVRSTPAHSLLATLIRDDYHDASRMLLVLQGTIEDQPQHRQ